MFGLKRPCPPAPCAAKSHARVYGAIVIGENKRPVGESKRKQDKSGKKVGSRKGVGILLPTIRPATGLPLTGVPYRAPRATTRQLFLRVFAWPICVHLLSQSPVSLSTVSAQSNH